MSNRILFMCPHAAGKSLAAAAYFRAAAADAGVDASIDVAGPDPDDGNMPQVVAALEAQGLEIAWQPQLVTADHVEAADIVVSIGCELADIPASARARQWDTPLISQDLEGALAAIQGHVRRLVDELAQPTSPS